LWHSARAARSSSRTSAIAWSSSRSLLADAGNLRPQFVGADRSVDDLALAEVRFSGVRAQDRRDLCVEIDAHLFAGSHKSKAIGHRRR